jgi:hypothetical protein
MHRLLSPEFATPTYAFRQISASVITDLARICDLEAHATGSIHPKALNPPHIQAEPSILRTSRYNSQKSANALVVGAKRRGRGYTREDSDSRSGNGPGHGCVAEA